MSSWNEVEINADLGFLVLLGQCQKNNVILENLVYTVFNLSLYK